MHFSPSRLGLKAVVIATALALVGSAGASDMATERPSPAGARSPRRSAPSTTAPSVPATVGTDGTDGTGGACSTESWPLEQRIRNLVFVSLPTGSRAELDAALAGGAGGVFVTSAAVPLTASGELAAATGSLPVAPLVSIDEEGGRVQRLRDTLPASRWPGRWRRR